jgi:hypothetical protein
VSTAGGGVNTAGGGAKIAGRGVKRRRCLPAGRRVDVRKPDGARQLGRGGRVGAEDAGAIAAAPADLDVRRGRLRG